MASIERMCHVELMRRMSMHAFGQIFCTYASILMSSLKLRFEVFCITENTKILSST